MTEIRHTELGPSSLQVPVERAAWRLCVVCGHSEAAHRSEPWTDDGCVEHLYCYAGVDDDCTRPECSCDGFKQVTRTPERLDNPRVLGP